MAYFTNETACHSVIRLLHQRQWIPSSGASKLTTRLRVEFLRSTDSESRIVNAHTVCDSSLKLTIRQNQARFSSPHVAKHNSLMSKYRFPPATLSVIQRISDTILSNSYFYHQVLLLMLQLGLHPPFDADNPPNDNLKVDNNSPLNDIALPKRKADDLLASDESELESGVDESTTVSKQPIYNPKRQRKVVKNLKTGFVGEKAPPKNKKTSANEIKPLTTTIEEVFESEQQPFKRNRSLEIKITTGLVAQPELEFISGTFGIIEPPDEAPEAAKKPLPSVSFDLATLTPSDLITDAILVAKTLPRTEWLHHKVFAGYRTNPICNRLYVKNLHKSTTLRDLYCLYGKFVNLNNSEHLNRFFHFLPIESLTYSRFCLSVSISSNWIVVECTVRLLSPFQMRPLPRKPSQEQMAILFIKMKKAR